MFIQEEVLFNSDKEIIDADCKRSSIIVLLKSKGETTVQLDGETILLASSHHYRIRFTSTHFCLLDRLESKLSFYTLTGTFVSEHDTGNDVYELFPYKEGVLCSYGDEGVFRDNLGKNMLNYFAPLQEPESFIEKALEHNLLYDPLIVRYKPFACISGQNNELIFLTDELKQQKAMKLPILPMHLIVFALTHEYAVFIENNKIWLWKFRESTDITEYPAEHSYKTRAIYHRHEYLFLTVSDHEVRAFKPVMSESK